MVVERKLSDGSVSTPLGGGGGGGGGGFCLFILKRTHF